MEKTHTYDVIIPVYHPGKEFADVLRMVKAQDPAPQKIILLETLEEGEEFTSYDGCEVVAVKKEDFDHSGTRRLGVSYSSAEAFIMMTQDALPKDSSLCRKLLEGLYAWEEPEKTGADDDEMVNKFIEAYKRSAGNNSFSSGTHPEDKLRLNMQEPKKKKTKRAKAKPPIDSTTDMDPDTSSWDNVPADRYVQLIREHERAGRNFPALPDGRIAMCYARQLPKEGCSEIERISREFNYPKKSSVKSIVDVPSLGIKAFFASDVCCAYNRDLYESVMGFGPKAVFNEDMLYAAKALKQGYRIAYKADALVYHSHNYTLSQQYHRNFDNGMSQAMHPEVFGGIASEGEGMKLVKETARALLDEGRFYLLPSLFFQSAAKYLGFRAGKRYQKYSYEKLHSLAMNKTFIEREFEKNNTER